MNNADQVEKITENARREYAAGRYKLAADLYLDAAVHYEEDGKSLQAAEMRNNSSVAFLKAGNAEAALIVVKGTAEIFKNAGDLRRQAMALGNQAAALEDLHDWDQALSDYQFAAGLLKDSNEREMRSLILKRISAIQLQQRKPVEALFAVEAAAASSHKPSWSDRIIQRLTAIIRKMLGLA